MNKSNDNVLYLGRSISRLAEHLAVEILAEATDQCYREAYVDQVDDLVVAAAALSAIELEVPHLVKEVIRISSECRGLVQTLN